MTHRVTTLWVTTLSRIIPAPLCLALLLVCGSLIGDSAHARTEADLEKLNREIRSLQKKAKNYQSRQSSLEKKLSGTEREIGKLHREIRQTKQSRSRLESELASLNRKAKKLEKQKSEQQAMIRQQIVAAYQLGSEEKLKILLNQEDPAAVARSLQYYQYFNQARSREIQGYLSSLQEIAKITPEITEKTAELQQQQNTLEHQRTALESQQSSRKKTISRIQADLKTTQQKIRNRERARKELEGLLREVEEAVTSIVTPEDVRPFPRMKGKLPWPVKGKRLNRYGSRRDSSQLKWQGVQLAASEGSGVRAVHHGRVVFADWFKGYGLLTIIDHGDSYLSLYAHNQSLLREAGEWVNGDEEIATVGNSGGNKQTALYFEIRHKGKPINPELWCRR